LISETDADIIWICFDNPDNYSPFKNSDRVYGRSCTKKGYWLQTTWNQSHMPFLFRPAWFSKIRHKLWSALLLWEKLQS